MPKRDLFEVWKKEGYWKVQFPKGIMTYRTKKEATRISDALKSHREV